MQTMTTFWRALRTIAALVVASTGLAAACDGGTGDALPTGWTGAQQLTVQQSMCDSTALSTNPTFELANSGGTITGTLRDANFRCQQQVCAYLLDSGATTRALVQPCELHPSSVPKCDCHYDVTFTLLARADRTTVEIYRRDDFYGATTPPEPILVATNPVE